MKLLIISRREKERAAKRWLGLGDDWMVLGVGAPLVGYRFKTVVNIARRPGYQSVSEATIWTEWIGQVVNLKLEPDGQYIDLT